MHIIFAKIKHSPFQLYNGLQFVLVLQGKIDVTIHSEKYELNTNQFILINPNDIYSFEKNDGTNIVLIIKIPFEYLRRECKDILQYQYRCYSENLSQNQHKYHEIRRMLINLVLTESSRDEGYCLKNKATLFQLLSFLLENFKATEQLESPLVLGSKTQRIASILKYIDEHYKNSITLNLLAEKEHVSIHYLSRQFKQEVGMNFIDYLTTIRLKSALLDLICTDDSVLKIALQNGFANSSAFIAHFKKKYQESPNQYRSKYLKNIDTSIKIQADCEYLSINDIHGIPELVDYIELYDRNKIIPNNIENVPKTTFDLNCTPISSLPPFERIINVIQCADILKSEIQKQLIFTQKKMNFQYILFQGIFDDGIFKPKSDSIYFSHEYNQTFSFLHGINLIPFIKLNVSSIIQSNIDPDRAASILELFLSTFQRCFSTDYLARWKFEIVLTDETIDAETSLYYIKLYKVIKALSSKIHIGFSIMQYDLNTSDVIIAQKRLIESIKYKCPPDFLTFTADPNKVINQFTRIDTASYETLKGYHLSLIQDLKNVLEHYDIAHLPLYMTEWNTIVGKNNIEFSPFYRIALIADAMLDVAGSIKGLSFWLNDYSNVIRGIDTCSLNLFHCHEIRRTLFFLLTSFSYLGNKVLYKNDNVIVTQNCQNEFIIMVHNPCFFDAKYAVDQTFIKRLHKNLALDIQNIEAGAYNIKVLDFKLKYTFAVHNHQALRELVDNLRSMDDDMADYVQNVVSPEFMAYETPIQNNYIIEPKLEHNAVIFYTLKKMS